MARRSQRPMSQDYATAAESCLILDLHGNCRSEPMANRPPLLGQAAASGRRGTLAPAAARRAAWLIMIVMALDHANFFIARAHSPGERWSDPLPRYEARWLFSRAS